MGIALYDATVLTFQQILPSLGGLVAKADAHCRAAGLPDSALSEARLAPDMWAFAKQVHVSCAHSAGAIDAVFCGHFSPDMSEPASDFASLGALVATASARLAQVRPEELDALIGRSVLFTAGARALNFTVEDYLLSFALPNFHFHTTTAYAILRAQGLAIGKRDYLGQIRTRADAAI